MNIKQYRSDVSYAAEWYPHPIEVEYGNEVQISLNTHKRWWSLRWADYWK